MGALNKFLGSPKEIEIDGEKLILHPLKVKDLAQVTKKDPTPEEAANIAKTFIKLSIPDATDEEIDSLPMDAYLKIMEEINVLNGFTDEQLDKIKRFAKQREGGN